MEVHRSFRGILGRTTAAAFLLAASFLVPQSAAAVAIDFTVEAYYPHITTGGPVDVIANFDGSTLSFGGIDFAGGTAGRFPGSIRTEGFSISGLSLFDNSFFTSDNTGFDLANSPVVNGGLGYRKVFGVTSGVHNGLNGWIRHFRVGEVDNVWTGGANDSGGILANGNTIHVFLNQVGISNHPHGVFHYVLTANFPQVSPPLVPIDPLPPIGPPTLPPTEIPEPASLLLLGSALAGASALRKRARKGSEEETV